MEKYRQSFKRFLPDTLISYVLEDFGEDVGERLHMVFNALCEIQNVIPQLVYDVEDLHVGMGKDAQRMMLAYNSSGYKYSEKNCQIEQLSITELYRDAKSLNEFKTNIMGHIERIAT